jgi:hypothetical protein
MAPKAGLLGLQAETALAFDAYIGEAEAQMQALLQEGAFLWSDAALERISSREKGEIPVQLWAGNSPVPVPHGLIHDWVGGVFVLAATMEKTLALFQDYDNHKNIYRPEVVDSKLLGRCGDDFQAYLRLLKKKIVTVVLDTYHEAHYSRLDRYRACCSSRSTRIQEVQDAGKAGEKLLAPDTGHGFLWRLYSYWKFREREDGTVIECRAISLTRDIPAALKLIVQPMVRSLPRDSLVRTLAATRQALAERAG